MPEKLESYKLVTPAARATSGSEVATEGGSCGPDPFSSSCEVEYDLDKFFLVTPSGQKHSVSKLLTLLKESAQEMSNLNQLIKNLDT